MTSAKSDPAAAAACVSDDDLLMLIYHVITGTPGILYLNTYIFYKDFFLSFVVHTKINIMQTIFIITEISNSLFRLGYNFVIVTVSLCAQFDGVTSDPLYTRKVLLIPIYHFVFFIQFTQLRICSVFIRLIISCLVFSIS